MNNLIILGALLVVQGEFTSICKYKCTSNNIDNQIILSIKNEANCIEELYDCLRRFPIYKIELSNQNKEDIFLLYKINFQDCGDNNLHYYLNKIKNINAMDGWLVYSFIAFEGLIKSNSLPYCY